MYTHKVQKYNYLRMFVFQYEDDSSEELFEPSDKVLCVCIHRDHHSMQYSGMCYYVMGKKLGNVNECNHLYVTLKDMV